MSSLPAISHRLFVAAVAHQDPDPAIAPGSETPAPNSKKNPTPPPGFDSQPGFGAPVDQFLVPVLVSET